MEADLLERLAEQTPAWRVRVTLAAMRDRGWPFDAAWTSATQRLRIQPNMSPDDAEDLIEFKAWLDWCKPIFEWAYHGGVTEKPQLVDGEIFTGSEQLFVGKLGARLSAAGTPVTDDTRHRPESAQNGS